MVSANRYDWGRARSRAIQKGIDVNLRSTLSLAIGAMLLATAVCADEVIIAKDVLGPEGPLFVDGNLYYVGFASDTLSKWDGHKSVILNHTPGCGHNGLALTKQNTLLIACGAEHGAIIETDMMGKELRKWDADSKGKKLYGGINDIVMTANGGAYANGIGISPDQKTLYVSETVGNCILKFSVNADGTLSNRSNFALLSLLVPNKAQSWWLGPDSMKIDSKGNMYVAQWTGGKILKLSPQGKLLHVFHITAGDGTTNVTFSSDENYLYVTAAKNPNDPQARGSIVKIPNVK
jgi:gluconolactonase